MYFPKYVRRALYKSYRSTSWTLKFIIVDLQELNRHGMISFNATPGSPTSSLPPSKSDAPKEQSDQIQEGSEDKSHYEELVPQTGVTDVRTWYFGSLDRTQTEKLLQASSVNTYLVRTSSMEGRYALSIFYADKQQFVHCIPR